MLCLKGTEKETKGRVMFRSATHTPTTLGDYYQPFNAQRSGSWFTTRNAIIFLALAALATALYLEQKRAKALALQVAKKLE